MTTPPSRSGSRPRGRSLLVQLVALAGGGVIGWAFMAVLDAPDRAAAAPSGGLLFGLLLAVVPLVVLVHESGHLVAGLLNRFRFQMLILGPVRLERAQVGVRVGASRTGGMATAATVMLPDDTVDLRRRTVAMVAGGPLASLLFGAALLLLAAWAPSPGPQAAAFRLAAQAAGFLSVVAGLGTLLPHQAVGLASDGKQILRLLRGDAAGATQVAVLCLIAMARAGRRPRDWPEDVVRRAVALRDGSELDAVANQLAVSFERDRGDLAAAERHMERSLDLAAALGPDGRRAALYEGAVFFALHRSDPERARRLLDAAGPGGGPDRAARSRATAAVLAAEGFGDEALDALAAARAAYARDEPDPTGETDEELDGIERMIATAATATATRTR